MPSAHTSVTSQQLAFSQPATPKAFQPSQDVTGQQAAGSSESQVFSKELGDLLGTIPKDEKGFAFLASVIKALGGTIDDVGSKADAQGRNSLLKSFDERMKVKLIVLPKPTLQRLVLRHVCQLQPHVHPHNYGCRC